MFLIRNFEARAEAAYQQGKIGGFLHLYVGQEAIAVGAVSAVGQNNWWTTTYRCHAFALLLGVSPNEAMAELYGRANGNAKGRGGSMHLYSDRLTGGYGIVGGHIPIAIGTAFALKYQGKNEEISLCFLGDGAVPQGAFHESLNLAALWDLPCLFVIENNQWGMGTAVSRAVAVDRIAEKQAVGYGIEGYTIDGMDFFSTYAAFKHFREKICKEGRPILVEMLVERFRGHSISDPALYRSKEELHKIIEKDPLERLKHDLIGWGMVTEEECKEMNAEAREQVLQAMKYADESPWPSEAELEEGVFANGSS
ncbi:MAG: pyruvate dehydrogenase (acetyl-transferring) E1 component subunit alpha [Verrucomicrobia bacterium]|nr:pyruvate dehydrogenase (acetyl-transferring) E1 component subunit alpha [Verrucomicrobiota bacterium]